MIFAVILLQFQAPAILTHDQIRAKHRNFAEMVTSGKSCERMGYNVDQAGISALLPVMKKLVTDNGYPEETADYTVSSMIHIEESDLSIRSNSLSDISERMRAAKSPTELATLLNELNEISNSYFKFWSARCERLSRSPEGTPYIRPASDTAPAEALAALKAGVDRQIRAAKSAPGTK